MKAAITLCLGLGLAVLAGCAYRGEIDDPVTIKATWFSYLNGDDIRAACVPGAEPWYRLVYNGAYDEQLRAYEVAGEGAGGALFTARVMTGRGLNVTNISLADLTAVGGWTKAQDRLSPSELAEFEGRLEDSDAFGPTPAGLRLASEQFYWIASLCRDGRFHFNAWRYRSARYDRLSFPAGLLDHDRTGIAVNPPREDAGVVLARNKIARDDGRRAFSLTVAENGLAGHITLF